MYKNRERIRVERKREGRTAVSRERVSGEEGRRGSQLIKGKGEIREG